MAYIFHDCSILNLHSRTWDRASVLVEKDRIIRIGSLQECRLAATTSTETIYLNGRLLLPSFTDAHTHFVEYAKSRILVNLLECNSLDKIHYNLQDYRNNLNWSAQWILGGGWDRNKLDNPNQLNRHFLDTLFPNLPVALMSKDYHSKLCNSKALAIAGIDQETPNPPGGNIERLADGSPSGVLYETAAELIDKHIVFPVDNDIINAIKQTVESIYPLGLTGFHSMESLASRNLLLQAQNQVTPFRLCWHVLKEDFGAAVQEGLTSYRGDEWFKPGGLKIFGDGSLGSQTAAMFDDYPEGGRGILRQTDSELYTWMQEAAEHGFACSIHAIGNRCVRQVIDCTLKLQRQTPYQRLFHRIEHVQSIRNEDIYLLKQSGLFASVQPVHLANDVPMIKQHWGNLENQVYSFGSMHKAGIPLGFGSDAPIETINPFLGIYAAIQRRPHQNPYLPQFRTDESLNIFTALRAYTLGAAEASLSGDQRGSIEPGKLADLIVFDDFRIQPDDFWLSAQSRLTVLNGKIVFSDL